MNSIFMEKKLICADCGEEFTFTEGEQKFYWSKGLANPKRCKPCRMVRRRSIVSVQNIKEEQNADLQFGGCKGLNA